MAARSASSFDVKLGERVRARRLALGISQQELAEALGITFQQIQKYEKGTNRIAASRICDIAQTLNMPVCDFFEGLVPGAKKAAPVDETTELTSLFGRISSKKTRRQVIDLVRTMASG